MNICFVASECVPFVKTGGLADVLGSLPRHIQSANNTCRIVIPRYSSINVTDCGLRRVDSNTLENIRIGQHSFENIFWEGRLPDSEVLINLVECPHYFDRKQIYTNDPDEGERFLFLQKAALNVLRASGSSPDILHCNDWQAGLLPALIRHENRKDSFFETTRTVFTIHNLAYHGTFPLSIIDQAGLDPNETVPGGTYEYYGSVSMLKAGICVADAVTTVSPTYAREILTPEQGAGMDSVLRARPDNITGILNGIDLDTWNPVSDPLLPHNFSDTDLTGKDSCRTSLLNHVHLPVISEVPVIGIVSRFADQKGFALLFPFLSDLLQERFFQLIVLGTGDAGTVRYFQKLEAEFPDMISLSSGYNEELAHLIEGGADIFLMPSRYEPCGLNQMYSMRYGTIPVVRRTGGLADTVFDVDENPERGNGFSFGPYSSDALERVILRAIRSFSDKTRWSAIQRRGMTTDYSWTPAALRYTSLYSSLLASGPGSTIQVSPPESAREQ
jgi:starch synthase